MKKEVTKIYENDAFLDIYQSFFDLYNKGFNPTYISKKIQEDFTEMFNDYDDKNNCLFALALAQWETKSVDLDLYNKVKNTIENGEDLQILRASGVSELIIEERKKVLDDFILQISTKKEKPRRRQKPKLDFKTVEIFRAVSPDKKKVFESSKHYTNGIYEQTGSLLSWITGGISIFYFVGEDQFINAKWIDSQKIEVRHDKNIVFTKKEEKFYHIGDRGVVIYVPE